MTNPPRRKLYYSISEVAEITKLQPYTLRAWEKEFSCLRPKRIHGKNRSYRGKDIGVVLLIKRLLYDERYTTQGANLKLKNEPELLRNITDFEQFLDGESGGSGTLTGGPAGPGAEPAAERTTVSSGPASDSGAERPRSSELDAAKELIDSTRKELNELLRILG